MTTPHAPADPKGAIIAFNEGANHMATGNEAAAVAAWHKALELDPTLIPAARNLVTYYQRIGDMDTELRLWELVLAFDPFDTDHLVLQAAALKKGGHYPQAIGNYQRAIAIYPYFKFWYHELSHLYAEVGDPSEAALWKGRGDTLDADVAEMCYQDGVRHAKEERWPSARTCFEAVLDDFPANLDARLRLIQVLEHCGTPKEAETHFETALDLTQVAKGLVHFTRGEHYLRIGSPDEAKAAFAEALRCESRYGKVHRALNSLTARAASVGGAPATATPPSAVATQDDSPVLQAADIGMERIETWPPTPVPDFRAPNPRLPWQHQVRQVLDQVLSVSSPSGNEPRIALVVEADPELAPALSYALSELTGIGRSLRADAQRSHIFVVEASRNVRAGWLGQDEIFSAQPHQWQRRSPGISLRKCLEAVRDGSAGEGFNCLLLLTLGRADEEQTDVKRLIGHTRIFSLCAVQPYYHYVDVRTALGEVGPNYMDILV